jgi:hypothetical protein
VACSGPARWANSIGVCGKSSRFSASSFHGPVGGLFSFTKNAHADETKNVERQIPKTEVHGFLQPERVLGNGQL